MRQIPPTPNRRSRVAAVAVVALSGLLVLAAMAAPAEARPSADKAAKASSRKEPVPTTADAPEAATVDGTLRRAAVQVAVATTSDWVQVDLPGSSAGHVVVANPEGRDVHPIASGFVVTGPAAHATVTVDLVVEVPRTQEQGWIVVTQGGAGASAVDVANRTGELVPVTRLVTDWTTTRRHTVVTADQLMGDEQLEWVRADTERRVLAFSYPWFGEWAETDPSLPVHPSSTWRSDSADDALAMAQLARANGIDGFVMSFSGGAVHGLPLHHALRAAEQTGGTATVLIETTHAGSAEVVEQWIAQALRQASSPAFQRLDGVPVVFVFETGLLAPATWQAISDRLAAAGTPVHIVGDTWHGAMAGQYRYNAMLQSPTDEMTEAELTTWNQAVSRGLRAEATLGSGEPGLVVATVQPGWDDSNLRGDGRVVVDRDGTAAYDATWRAALAGEADWVVITSWNEWYEATGVAPSKEYGDTALRASKAWAERFAG